MSEIAVRRAAVTDLNAVTELERQCFPASEAADAEAFLLRLTCFPDCFWLLEADGKITAMINGMTTHQRDLCDTMYHDTSLYAPDGAWLMLYGVAAAPAAQHRGFASRLLSHVTEEAKKRCCQGIVLTCKTELIPFYQRFGFVSEGLSASAHGGASWYQMRLTFSDELRRCAHTGEECSFYRDGNRYLLYGWNQCDGFYLNVADESGTVIWQFAGSDPDACAKAFFSADL